MSGENREKESGEKTSLATMFITTGICLAPILAGVLLYNQLPDMIPTHFNFSGEVDGWSSKAMAVFGLPGFVAAVNVLLHIMLRDDPKRANIDGKMKAVAIWTVPVMSVLVSTMTLGAAIGVNLWVERVMPALMGILFILLGNFMPKTKQSYTTGIKLPWTLNSEENWNRTHRLAGFLWVLGGAAFLLVTLLDVWNGIVLGVILGVMVLVPTVYSYILHKKGI